MNTAEEAPEALNIYIMNTQIQQPITEELSPAQIKAKAWYQANKDKLKAKYKANKERIQSYSRSYHKTYYEANRERRLNYIKAYHKANKNKRRAYTKKYTQTKLKTDSIYKFVYTLRTHSRRAFKRIKENKPINTTELLGCTWSEAKEYIERLFQPGMTWSNHGVGEKCWHIDHKIPIASATTIEEAIKLNHISNLQPLWQKDNLSKGAKVREGCD
jgi:hypothetical protein